MLQFFLSQVPDEARFLLAGWLLAGWPHLLAGVALGVVLVLAAALYRRAQPRREERFSTFFQRSTVQDLPIELAVLSPGGTYLYANSRACRDQVSPQWLEGKTDVELCRRLGLHPEVARRRRSHRRRALRSGKRVQFREVLSGATGSSRHVERFYTPVFEQRPGGGADEASAVVTYAVDKTHLKKREEAFKKAQRASEEYQEMKKTLLRNLRHEFRTPLTSILSAAEVLEEEVAAEQQDFVEIVHLNGRRLLRTLNAMLDLAGLQTSSVSQYPRVLKLAGAVEGVVSELKGAASGKGLFLRQQALVPEVFVRVDPASLYRVLHSIISNAVKFTDQGGVVVEVGANAKRATIRVIDTGVGIKESYQSQLFDSFRQENEGLARRFEGTGVGLAVAKRLLKLMSGTVSVESEKGKGSIFTVTLPRAFRDANGERPCVLVADGKKEQQNRLRHQLEEHVCLTVVSGIDEALEAARRQRFAAVLVSARLTSGAAAGEVAGRFRAVKGYDRVSLVVIDRKALPGASEQFEAAGYDGYVAPPLRREVLLSALGDALEGRTDSSVAASEEASSCPPIEAEM